MSEASQRRRTLPCATVQPLRRRWTPLGNGGYYRHPTSRL
jgi:hypothetical protein